MMFAIKNVRLLTMSHGRLGSSERKPRIKQPGKSPGSGDFRSAKEPLTKMVSGSFYAD